MTTVADRFIRRAARRVHANYSEFIELEDLVQEGAIWALHNEATIERLLGGPVLSPARFMATVMARMDSVAMDAKAIVSGYEESALYLDRMVVVELALTQLFNEVGEQDHPEGWASVLDDVQRAWKAAGLDESTQWVLGARYAAIMPERATGDLLGLSKTTVHRRVRQGLLAVAKQLTTTTDLLRKGGCYIDAPHRGVFPEEP
jgi:DNA-directed RNA polymerase specialized sigma24 family protein